MENRYKNEKIFYALMILIVYSSSIYFFSFITADPDLWGHIRFGKEILESNAIPQIDIYSYTANGMRWINHEWVSEVLMYIIYNNFGSPGLLIGKTLIGLVIITFLSVICFNRKIISPSYGVVFILSVFIISPGFMIRPQLMTFFCFTLFFLVIHYYLERRINLLWALPLIMILWVNSHGGFIIGAGILPIIFVLEYLDCHIKKKDKGHLRNLIIWTIITEASMLINPYGLNLLIFIHDTLSLPREITEWEAVTLFDLSFLRFKIFSICIILSFFIKRHKNRYWEIGIIIVAMFYAFLHQRHTPILAIFAAPFLTEKLFELAGYLKNKEKILSTSSYAILSIFMVSIIGYQLFTTITKYKKYELNIIVNPNIYPVSAVRFLKTNNVKGNLLVPFDWGEYAIWKLYPDNRVSIDGRFRTVYPEEVIIDHFRSTKNQEAWSALLDKYPTDIVLARRNPFSESMITEPSDEWLYVYSDSISIIFLKKSEPMKDVVERFKTKKFVYPNDELSIYFP